MTVPVDAEDAPRPHPKSPASAAAGRDRQGASALDVAQGLCPYLVSAGGAWRTAAPSRNHRCGAVQPPAPQSTDKQRRYCLSVDHVECPMFRAARAARATSLIAGGEPMAVDGADRARRPLARTAPVLLEPPRLVDQAVRLRFDRAPGQVALIGLMVFAFAVVALARFTAGGAAAVSPSPSMAALAPSRAPTPTPLRPSASVGASSGPSASVAPSVRTTYKVKKGDTLLAIARTYSTSPAKIRAANGMTSSALKIGQVLKIP